MTAAKCAAMLKSLLSLSTVVALTSVAAADEFHHDVVATEISVGATAGSLALIGAGLAMSDPRGGGPAMFGVGAVSLLLTPALGHAYGEHTLLTTGTELRGVGLSAMLVGFVIHRVETADSSFCGTFDNGSPGANTCTPQPQPSTNTGLYVLGAGAALVLTGVVLDIATAGSSTRHWQNEHSLALGPTVVKSSTGSSLAGGSLSGRF